MTLASYLAPLNAQPLLTIDPGLLKLTLGRPYAFRRSSDKNALAIADVDATQGVP